MTLRLEDVSGFTTTSVERNGDIGLEKISNKFEGFENRGRGCQSWRQTCSDLSWRESFCELVGRLVAE